MGTSLSQRWLGQVICTSHFKLMGTHCSAISILIILTLYWYTLLHNLYSISINTLKQENEEIRGGMSEPSNIFIDETVSDLDRLIGCTRYFVD